MNEEETRKAFSTNLRYYMDREGLNQADISRMLGVSESAVGKWLKMKSTPRMGIVEKLSIHFGIKKSDLLEASKSDSDLLGAHENQGVKIPVVGCVAAGVPISAIEEILDWEEIPLKQARTGEFFGLKIRGSSMEPRIYNGDVVIVKKQNDADSGDIVVAQVNGDEALCKKLIKQESGIILQSLNQDYPTYFFSQQDIENKPVTIIGKVVELRAKF